MKHYEVATVIIINDDKILCSQGNVSKYQDFLQKFQFPGVELKSDETNEQALSRKFIEEFESEIISFLTRNWLSVLFILTSFEMVVGFLLRRLAFHTVAGPLKIFSGQISKSLYLQLP